MRVYSKDSKKSLPFIDYKKINTSNDSILEFLNYFAWARSFGYSKFFKFENLKQQEDFEYKDLLNDWESSEIYKRIFIKEKVTDYLKYFFSKNKCVVKHKNKILAAWVTNNFFVYSAEEIKNYLAWGSLYSKEHISKKLQTELEMRKQAYCTSLAYLEIDRIHEDHPELKLIQTVSGI